MGDSASKENTLLPITTMERRDDQWKIIIMLLTSKNIAYKRKKRETTDVHCNMKKNIISLQRNLFFYQKKSVSLRSSWFKHLTYLLKPVSQETPAQAAAWRTKDKEKKYTFHMENHTYKASTPELIHGHLWIRLIQCLQQKSQVIETVPKIRIRTWLKCLNRFGLTNLWWTCYRAELLEYTRVCHQHVSSK